VRRPYDQSVAILKERIDVIGEPLASLDRRPQHDDEVLGPSIFRMIVEDVAVNELSLPCLYVGRSKLQRVSFTSSDLHLSAINWSDLVECDFSRASLVDADLRACKFASCVFTGADLSGADLRGSSFEGCTFEGAIMRGTQLYRPRKRFGVRLGATQETLPLSDGQRAEVTWCEDSPEPGGG
jgi:BTB/POZ domain-containing protein KCTD9